MYRWSVDLFGPLPETKRRRNKYVLIAVEHWTKHLVLVPLVDKTPACTAYAFKYAVLAYHGACAEVCTDGGREWLGEFDALMTDCFIDHRVTSPYHPQANGGAERCVQTAKRALRKYCEAVSNGDT
jgi:transposase-like protein